ncbi:MAG TPA: protein kinase, partial [Kofleriaceae bacterium]
IMGTPAYMAPEQCLGSSECDHRADLYALGCILFEMLAGQPPYSAVPTSDLLAAHIRQPVPDLGRLVTVPSQVLRLVTRLLAKSPDDRPRSALEVVAEIDRWLASRGHAPPPRRRSLSLALVAASGIAISLTVLGVWYRWWRAVPAPVLRAGDSVVSPRNVPFAEGTKPPVVDTTAPTLPMEPPEEPPDAGPPPKLEARRPARVRTPPVLLPVAPVEVTPELGSAASGGVETTVVDVDP